MDWVREFYEKQDQWDGAYRREIGPEHQEQALRVDQALKGRKGRVLDLGCGGGQSAASIAALGHQVVGVDFNRSAIGHARELATASEGRMSVVQGDFYEVELEGRFDAITYFDGFGVGTDADQRRLFDRIAAWLAPAGRVLIDVYTPWYWAQTSGETMAWEDVARRYLFDADGCRVIDTWWQVDQPDEAITQSLRCYSPADLRLLLQGSGLVLIDRIPGGSLNYETGVYTNQVPLEEAMSYLAILAHAPETDD